MTIISLTTIPSRFDKIGPTLETLLAQKGGISEIRLYIPRDYKRFPDYDGSLPPVPAGIDIHRCKQDFGPGTKVLPAAEELRGTGQRILFCDDDRLYSSDWSSKLIEAGRRYPDRVICVIGWHLDKWLKVDSPRKQQPAARFRPGWADLQYRGKRIAQQLAARRLRPVHPKPARKPVAASGFVDVFGGYGGVLIDPDWLEGWASAIPDGFWAVDDIWLSGCLARRGVKIWAQEDLALAPASAADRTDALFRSQFGGQGRDALNISCIEHLRDTYDIWR